MNPENNKTERRFSKRTGSGSASQKKQSYKNRDNGKHAAKDTATTASLPDIRESMPDPAEIRDILGQISEFKVLRLTPIGAFITPLNSEGEDTVKYEILLPKSEFESGEPKRYSIIRAFLYLDSEDRPVATMKKPVLLLGGLALLKCTEVTPVGAFLDWGLKKDLFLPFREQTAKVKAGQEVLVTLYMDKSSRLCASMKVYKLLRTDSEYKANDHVSGLVYEISDLHGAYVAIDDIYSAMIPAKDLVKTLKVGDRPNLRVSKVLPDGKLELSLREPAHLQINDDCDRVLNELKASSKGFLPYHDKTESLIIKNKFNMSKIAFKRAIGHLYRQGLIEIREDGIALTSSN